MTIFDSQCLLRHWWMYIISLNICMYFVTRWDFPSVSRGKSFFLVWFVLFWALAPFLLLSFILVFLILISFTGPSLRAKSTVPEQKTTVWLPYSRFVVRELVWMQPGRDCLFSSASSSMVARLLPSMLFDLRKFEDAVIVSIDVKDAFLTVSQETWALPVGWWH